MHLSPHHLSYLFTESAHTITTLVVSDELPLLRLKNNVQTSTITLDWAYFSECDESVVYQVPGPGVSDRLHVSRRGGHSNWGCQRFSRPRRTVQGTHYTWHRLFSSRTITLIVSIYLHDILWIRRLRRRFNRSEKKEKASFQGMYFLFRFINLIGLNHMNGITLSSSMHHYRVFSGFFFSVLKKKHSYGPM